MDLIPFAQEFRDGRELLAVYCNKQSVEVFLVGAFLGYDADYLALALLSQDACFDGLCLCATENVFRIELNNQYLKGLNASLHPHETLQIKKDPWDEILSYAEFHKDVIQIKDFSGKRIMFGIPMRHTKDQIMIRRVCLNGALGKIYRICRSKIALLVCNSSSEKKLQIKLQGGKSDAL